MTCLVTAATVKTSGANVTQQDIRNQLEGTWQSLSRKVMTGPTFYDPVDELLIEPALPGFAYSFDKEGNFEQSIYQVTSNPQNHSCPSASLIWQHGKYEYDFKAKQLKLIPIKIDGRQLLSEPCQDGGISTYMRFNQNKEVIFADFNVEIDGYFGDMKLQLFGYDYTPIQPLWLTYKPPMMLPPQVLNPTSKDSLVHKYKRAVEYLTYKIDDEVNGDGESFKKPIREDSIWDYVFKLFMVGVLSGSCVLCYYTVSSIKTNN
ncbi:chaperone for protein-folding within the ER, fungal-domain-containing protein [Scheffersomyces coipomensis]|uniref:chaperone for protein-folding within the ER, fungal-domain-containing protein n=1 Tax=Scheffersomyces coipomensis TaxID=1788519 RepID=UPI00315C8734